MAKCSTPATAHSSRTNASPPPPRAPADNVPSVAPPGVQRFETGSSAPMRRALTCATGMPANTRSAPGFSHANQDSSQSSRSLATVRTTPSSRDDDAEARERRRRGWKCLISRGADARTATRGVRAWDVMKCGYLSLSREGERDDASRGV